MCLALHLAPLRRGGGLGVCRAAAKAAVDPATLRSVRDPFQACQVGRREGGGRVAAEVGSKRLVDDRLQRADLRGREAAPPKTPPAPPHLPPLSPPPRPSGPPGAPG